MAAPETVLITGANRQTKTTNALRHGFDNCMAIVYVVRTENNILSTLETFQKYVDPKGEYTVTLNLGKQKICPEFDKEPTMPYIVEKTLNCVHCSNRKDNSLHKSDYEMIRSYKIMDREATDSLLSTYGICPKTSIRAHMRELAGEMHLILTTYAGLKNLGMNYLEDALIIFDEARHLTDSFSTLYQKSLHAPSTMSFNSIVAHYIKSVRDIQIPEYLDDIKKIKEILNKWCVYVQESHQVHIEAQEHEKNHKQSEVLDGLYPAEEIICAVKKPSFRGIKKIIMSMGNILAGHDNDPDFIRLFLLLDCVQHATVKDSVLRLDYVTDSDTKNTVSIVIRDMDGINGSRKLLKKAIKVCDSVYFVDSTPYPTHFLRFWLGMDSIETREVNTTYKFRFVVEDASYSMANCWGDRGDAESFTQKIIGVVNGVDKDMHIFCRSHADRRNLNKYGIDANVARGINVEGIQLDGFTLATGFPSQNASSEEYLKYELSRLTGLLPNEAIKEYRRIKGCQELVQESLRTANLNGLISGSVWMGISYDIAEYSMKYWKWLAGDTMEFIRIPRYLHITDKIKFMVQGLTTGTIPEFTETETRIMEDMMKVMEEVTKIKKTELIRRVAGQENTKRRVIKNMIKKNLLNKKIVKYPYTEYIETAIGYKFNRVSYSNSSI